MTALPFVSELLGWRGAVPNTADVKSATSRAIAGAILEALGITTQTTDPGQTAGARLEAAVEDHLADTLPPALGGYPLTVARRPLVTDFDQYRHLADLKRLIEEDETRTLRASVGTDYVIRPDVTVGLGGGAGPRLLHAAVPCKWTLRSDRAQNVRHEAVVLIRHRRGRLPHITPVTAEPLPTRLASLARGTAEVDAVYHVALHELRLACEEVNSPRQLEVLTELVEHRRLRDLGDLAPTLSV